MVQLLKSVPRNQETGWMDGFIKKDPLSYNNFFTGLFKCTLFDFEREVVGGFWNLLGSRGPTS